MMMERDRILRIFCGERRLFLNNEHLAKRGGCGTVIDYWNHCVAVLWGFVVGIVFVDGTA